MLKGNIAELYILIDDEFPLWLYILYINDSIVYL